MLQCMFNGCLSDIWHVEVRVMCANQRQSASTARLVAVEIGQECLILTVIAEVITIINLQPQVELPVVEIYATMSVIHVHLPAPLI
jgi:hypothetical protein